MHKRKLGRSPLEVVPLAFGGNVFGWTADAATSHRLLDRFVDDGFNLIDTADVYSRWAPGHHGGESEILIGNWLKKSGKRNRVLLATKVGMEMSAERKGLSARHIAAAVEDSLRRLQTDTIDLYQAHTDDAATPLPETLEAFDKLIRSGKVRAIGASNYSAARLQESLDLSESHGWARFESLQPLYNLYDRAAFEDELAAVCRDNELGVISYFSLAAGFLTGKYRQESDLTGSARGGRVKEYLNPRGARIIAALERVAGDRGVAPARVALAWLIARPGITAPIASATSLEQWEELAGAVRLELPRDALAALDAASAPDQGS
jgi:aryl-alcohol dehydrogenase-like predicted oxidoreductase